MRIALISDLHGKQLALDAVLAEIVRLGCDQLLVFHGSPRSHMKDLLMDTPTAALDEALDGHSADVVAGGHTHVQLTREHRGMLLCNPGSLGLPFAAFADGEPPTILPRADFGVVVADEDGLRFEQHSLPLDPDALIAQMGDDYPLREYVAACDRA